MAGCCILGCLAGEFCCDGVACGNISSAVNVGYFSVICGLLR